MSVPRTLFVGTGKAPSPGTAARCRHGARPDWVGVAGEPGGLHFLTGLTAEPLDERRLRRLRRRSCSSSRAAPPGWTPIRALAGARHHRPVRGRRLAARRSASCATTTSRLLRPRGGGGATSCCMRAADGVICSTEWLASATRPSTRARSCAATASTSSATRSRAPQRDEVADRLGRRHGPRRRRQAVGGRRGRGHARAPDTRFISVGQPFAQWLEPEFGAAALPVRPVLAVRHLPGRDDPVRRRAGAGRQGQRSSAARATCAGSRPARSASR